MTGLFQRTSAPIQTAMLVEMIRLLQECQQTVNLPDIGEEPTKPNKSAEAYRLEQMGFTNAAPIAEYQRQVEQYEASRKMWESRERAKVDMGIMRLNRIMTVRTLIEARETFGEDTLLIPYGDFERLIRKYNLVCGPFSSYKGAIPSDKVDEISRLQLLMRDKSHRYINRLSPITGLRYDENHYWFMPIPGYIKRFPFAKSNGSRPYWGSSDLRDMHGKEIKDSWKWEYTTAMPVELFICAPSRHMEKIKSLKVPRLISYSDPFICAHTDYGILVFTRWGEEADDKIIRKYESANRWLDKAREFIGHHADCANCERRGGFCD